MKVPGQPQQPVASRFKGTVQIRYTKRWGMVLCAWPRRRGPPKSPVTQAQVEVWDAVQQMIKFADASEVAIAKTISNNTAFYARDILASAAYGNYVSWPGFGLMSDGPTVAEGGERVWGPLGKRKTSFTGPRSVNNVISYSDEQWIDPTMTVTVTTSLPAPNIQLWMSCEPYQLIPKDTVRGGNVVAHGKKQFAPSVCGSFVPTSITGNTASFSLTPCCDCGGTCYYWVGELDSDTDELTWSGLIRPCPPCIPVLIDGTVGITPAAGFTTDLPWTNGGFFYRQRYHTGTLSFNFVAARITGTPGATLSGTFAATTYSSGGHGFGSWQAGIADRFSTVPVWVSPVMSTAAGVNTPYSFDVPSITIGPSGQMDVLISSTGIGGDSSGFGIGFTGTDPGFDLVETP